MELGVERMRIVKDLALAKGDVLETIMVERLLERGLDPEMARAAARECSNRIWRNAFGSGSVAMLLLGTVFTPVVGGIAGSSFGVSVGLYTFLTSEACTVVRDDDLHTAARKLIAGVH